MKPLPFKMRQVTPMEKYRAESFWFKEFETLAWIESFDPSGVFFDIGANVGVYSLYCAALYSTAKIHAFEPMPANNEALRLNAERNCFSNIYAWPYALGEEMQRDITLKMPDAGEEAGLSGAQLDYTGIWGEVVHVMCVDRLCSCKGGLPLPDYVKIDIDGQEAGVIKGMMTVLPTVKSMLVEVSSKSKAEIVDILTGAGFSTDNRFNTMTPHSRERRAKEGIDAENIIFAR